MTDIAKMPEFTDLPDGRHFYATDTLVPWADRSIPSEFDPLALVVEFNETFETSKDSDLWVSLVNEELAEFAEALSDVDADPVPYFSQCLKEAADLLYVLLGSSWADATVSEHAFNTADSLLNGFKNVVGAEPIFEAFYLVHQSNMSKLGNDGKPVRREDGKVLKGPNYKPPNLDHLANDIIVRLNASGEYIND